jgi:hypothetical protein
MYKIDLDQVGSNAGNEVERFPEGLDTAFVHSSAASTTEPKMLIYPNPASESATISMFLTSPGEGKLLIYDVRGKLVKQIYAGVLPEGRQTYKIQTDNLAAGNYQCRLLTNDLVLSKKLIIIH